MKKIYTQKLIGTSVMAIFLLAFSLIGFSYAQAQFNDNNNTAVIDGLVTAKSDHSITVWTAGANSIIINVDDSTVFTKNMDFSDLMVNSTINATVKTANGNNLAKVIKINDSAGYGYAGGIVQIHKAQVISKSIADQTITVKSDLTVTTIQITASTKFMKTSFNALKSGDTVNVKGMDSGSAFLAEHVILMK